jgi:hypothetical protein
MSVYLKHICGFGAFEEEFFEMRDKEGRYICPKCKKELSADTMETDYQRSTPELDIGLPDDENIRQVYRREFENMRGD